MISVQDVLQGVPHFDTFCSVQALHDLVERLRADERFKIETLGMSPGGVPIHHVRFGEGSVKALIVGGPHAMEPIGGLTVSSLMTLLHQRTASLLAADVEWHFVPCINPDGALLNEGWSLKPFTLQNYMRHFYLEATRDQIDTSFPIAHKNLTWSQPTQEAVLLQGVLSRVRPDFFFSLHNAWIGGAFYFISRDIGQRYYRELHALLEQQGMPIQKRPIWKEICLPFADGVVEIATVRKHYDYVEKTTPYPETYVNYGGASWDYLAEIKPDALTFVAEMGYLRHPSDESERETGENFRQFKLKLDASSKFLATILLEEWDKVKEEVDIASPFYRCVTGGMVLPEKEKVCEGGMPLSMYPTREILFSPQYGRTMTEADRFNACMVDGGFFFPRLSYQFVRLLKASPQTAAVRGAIERLEPAFDEAIDEIGRYVDLDALAPIECDTLVKVQLGSGLIALNSLLETRTR